MKNVEAVEKAIQIALKYVELRQRQKVLGALHRAIELFEEAPEYGYGYYGYSSPRYGRPS